MDKSAKNKQPINNRKRFDTVFTVCIVVLSICALAVSGVLIYQKVYLTPFWVNGQSMYPTLNKDAKRANGELLGKTGGSVSAGCTQVDYGVMDTHKSALSKIKRFDIVVCRYSETDTSDKIKRVIGLPGETILFTSLPGSAKNGSVAVKNGDSYTYLEQPIPNEYIVEADDYPCDPITLKNDEYYVLGDNRAHSSDSRTHGPVKFDWLVGKVIAICAYCEIRVNDKGSYEPFNINYHSPRFKL